MTEWVHVSGKGNLPDFQTGWGCVAADYEIAKYAITNLDWCEFLNAWPLEPGLYHKDMTSGILGGIEKVKNVYVPKSGCEKKPVVYVNYVSLCKYCNWLTSGNIEYGSYDLSECIPRRVEGAKYVIPNGHEWYKAAYFENGRYWIYPTRGNEMPAQDQANFECGDNFSPLALMRSQCDPIAYSYLTDVDTYADSPTPCGAVQMGGNVWEFLEDIRQNSQGEFENTLRGGSFGYTETGLSKFNVDVNGYNGRCYVFGARIALYVKGWQKVKMPLMCRIVILVVPIIRRIVEPWKWLRGMV